MNKKRPPKRYSSEQELLDDIEKLQKRAEEKEKEATVLSLAAGKLLRSSNIDERDRAGYDLKKAEALLESAERIRETELTKLKELLAAFRTQTFPFLQDQSVV